MIAILILAIAAGAQTSMANAPVPSYASHLSAQQFNAYDR